MALAAVKTFVTGEVLYAADLNALNTNILNNALSLISPLTGTLNANNNQATNLRLENLAALPSAAQAGRIWWDSTDVELYLDMGSRIVRPFTANCNLLINGDFAVWQRGNGPFTSTTVPVNNDATYLTDRWVFLADGADTCDVSKETATLPAQGASGIRLDVETGNRKFGILQIIENADAVRVAALTTSLSFKARVTGTSIGALRAAVLSWNGAADAATRDVVSAWGAAGTNPTLVASWTYENTPSNLAMTTSYQTFRIENVAMDTSGITGVGVFLWVDDTDASVGDFVHITDIQLEEGRTATDFELRPHAEKLLACQRFAWAAQQPVSTKIAAGQATTATDAQAFEAFPVRMRATPTLAVDNAARFMLVASAGAALGTVTVASSQTNADMAGYAVVVATGLTAGDATSLMTSSITNGLIIWDAEL